MDSETNSDSPSDSGAEDFEFDFKLLKTKCKIRVKKTEPLEKIYVPDKEAVKNMEIDFYIFDERLQTFIAGFPHLKSILLLAVDDDFLDEKLIEMAAKLPVLSKMDIRIWNKLDRFDYNEYDIEVEGTDVIYQLMVKCQKLRQVKVLSKYDFRFRDLEDYDSVGSGKAKVSLVNFENKLKMEVPRWKFEYEIPLVDHNGTGYSYSLKKLK